MLRRREFTFLIVGGFNTLAGYGLVVGLYYLMSPRFGVLTIGLLANVLAISLSFCTLKLFVFRTRGRWLQEYLKSYLVYGSMALLSVAILWILVDKFGIVIWFAQGGTMLLLVVLSYIGHSKLTFGKQKD